MKETSDLVLSYNGGPDHSYTTLPLPTSPLLFLSPSVFFGDFFFLATGAVDSRCLTLLSGCLVKWSYNCLYLLFLHPNKPKMAAAAFTIKFVGSLFFWGFFLVKCLDMVLAENAFSFPRFKCFRVCTEFIDFWMDVWMYDARVKTRQYERPVQSILLPVTGPHCTRRVDLQSGCNTFKKTHRDYIWHIKQNNSHLFMSKQASPLIISVRSWKKMKAGIHFVLERPFLSLGSLFLPSQWVNLF